MNTADPAVCSRSSSLLLKSRYVVVVTGSAGARLRRRLRSAAVAVRSSRGRPPVAAARPRGPLSCRR
jgi:hypothetical protein